jgi:hypothetical protein
MDDAARVAELVELRSYALVPGGTDAFVSHFEAHFLASQEAVGMDIVGQFTVGDVDRFVWVRRHRSPAKRAEALTAFYTGPVWERHGPRANELMVDFSDVHLLRPDPSMPDFAAYHVPHAARTNTSHQEPDTGERAPRVVSAVYDLAGRGGLEPGVTTSMADTARDAHVAELGRLVTAHVPNGFPVLPVHEDATVAVWLMSDREGGSAATAAAAAVAAAHGLALRVTVMTPTARSTLR